MKATGVRSSSSNSSVEERGGAWKGKRTGRDKGKRREEKRRERESMNKGRVWGGGKEDEETRS